MEEVPYLPLIGWVLPLPKGAIFELRSLRVLSFSSSHHHPEYSHGCSLRPASRRSRNAAIAERWFIISRPLEPVRSCRATPDVIKEAVLLWRSNRTTSRFSHREASQSRSASHLDDIVRSHCQVGTKSNATNVSTLSCGHGPSGQHARPPNGLALPAIQPISHPLGRGFAS